MQENLDVIQLNILNITYGRGVGYKIEEEVLMRKKHKISATNPENK